MFIYKSAHSLEESAGYQLEKLCLLAWCCWEAEGPHCTMARSLRAWLRCFLALYPGRRNSIFLFLASILFLCFFSFFLAATSGFATAWKINRKLSSVIAKTVRVLLRVDRSYLHGAVPLAGRSPLWELPLDSRERQWELLQPDLLLQKLNQLLRQVLQGGI